MNTARKKMDTDTAKKKWHEIKRGKKVVVSEGILEQMQRLFGYEHAYNYLRTINNPNRIGVQDRYLAWISVK